MFIYIHIFLIFQTSFDALYYDRMASLLAYYIDLKLMSSQ